MNNKVLVSGAGHHNTIGIVESLGQEGRKSYVLIVDENTNSSSMEGSKSYVIIFKRRVELEEFLAHSEYCSGFKETGCYEI